MKRCHRITRYLFSHEVYWLHIECKSSFFQCKMRWPRVWSLILNSSWCSACSETRSGHSFQSIPYHHPKISVAAARLIALLKTFRCGQDASSGWPVAFCFAFQPSRKRWHRRSYLMDKTTMDRNYNVPWLTKRPCDGYQKKTKKLCLYARLCAWEGERAQNLIFIIIRPRELALWMNSV